MKRRKTLLCISILILLAGWALNGSAAEGKHLRILYVNDWHGFAEPIRPAGSPEAVGGIARLAGEVDRLRRNRPALLLAAGDMIQGNPWANVFQGESSIRVMNAMGLAAMTVGNHEFDFGPEILRRRIAQADFPVLGANIKGMPEIRPWVIKTVGGLRVLIIGLVTEDTPQVTHPRNVAGLHFSPPAEALRRIGPDQFPGVDLIVVLSHLGLPADIRLAREVPGIPLIIGGHSHTRIEKPMRVNGTWIVQAWEYGKVLGCLDLTVSEGRIVQIAGRLIPVGPGLEPSPPVAALVEQYQRRVQAELDEVIGEALTDLRGQGSREAETNLGDLLADILRRETGADLALLNGGGIRADIVRGTVKVRQVQEVLPFDNYPVVLRLTGREVKEVLEHGVSGKGGHGGAFPQVSGLRFVYRPTASPGERITEVMVDGRPLDPDGSYRLATNDFLAAGGDGYRVFQRAFPPEAGGPDWKPDPGAGRVVLFDRSRTMTDLVVAYFKKQKQVSAAVEGRIERRE